MKFENLFAKGRIGNLELKNRIVMPAMGTSLAGYNGEASPELIAFYEERARAGCGLIITEITRIDDEFGVGTPNQLSATNLKHIPSLERLAKTVHKYDTKIFLQLHHPGRESHGRLIDGRQIVAPSPIPCKVCKEEPRELTTLEVENLVKKFVTGAKFAQMAGIDGVELHGAHGYLICQFLSPYTNKRTDKYGGDFNGRMRFITEIIVGIKQICGKHFPISVRIDGDEFIEGGINLEEATKIAKYLESLGVDAINVSSGIYETGFTIIEPIGLKEGWKKHLAKTIKAEVNIPVIAVNNIKHPEIAEELLSQGVMDFAGIGRGQLADSQWSLKAYDERSEEIKPCISCLHCIEELEKCGTTKCAVNPRMGRELEFNNLEANGENKVVAVIGAGPAGLEASRVLSLRGFKVVLFEKENTLGGMVSLGSNPPDKEKLTWFIDYYKRTLESLGVEIKLNTKATIEAIKEINPYAVFIATGSNPVIPNLEGINNKNVLTVAQVLSGKEKVENESVVVIGSGMTGCETAEYLAVRGNKITLVEMLPQIGAGVYPSNLYTVIKNLNAHGTKFLTSHKLMKVAETSVELLNLKTNETIIIPTDKVVLSLGIRSNNAIAKELEDHFLIVKVIGDAEKPGRIAEAVRQGFEKSYIL